MIPSTSLLKNWTAPDGEIFSYSIWSPMSNPCPRAVLVAVHGLSGASLDFEPLAARLLRENIITLAPELRGQGNDPLLSRRGDLDRLDTWYHDLDAFFSQVRNEFPHLPIYSYGESMGAAHLTRYLTQEPSPLQPDGLVLASPVIALATQVARWQEMIFRLLFWIYPQLRIDVRRFTRKGEGEKWVTRDEAHRRWFETAGHKVQVFTLRFFHNLRELISGCRAAAPRLQVPCLLLYPGKDVFIPAELVEDFFQQIGSEEKEAQFYPEYYHLLLHDFDREEVLKDIVDWLLHRLRQNPKLA